MKILVIDDTPITRNILRLHIEKSGHEVIGEASDGEEGLSKYKSLNPDVVMMDLAMPRMDGMECLKAIREFDENAKVIICSASWQKDTIFKAIQSGAEDYIVKPFKEADVIEKLERMQSLIQ